MTVYTDVRILGEGMTSRQKIVLCMRLVLISLCTGVFVGVATGYITALFIGMG